ncbi:hypothetical protein [Desulforamulus putei]|uniref:hypothetical protein n=1 Tax=Desulforamulus putei TaxID=74701 RepID=UPI000933CB6D|nr:hypothetical protein [Desulforamulus putei]
MAGERGSNYNAFTLFLIFILLYLSQKGTNASAYSESGQTKADEYQQPEQPAEEKVAVGLSNGEVAEYQHTVSEMDEEITDDQQEISVQHPEVIEQTEEQALEETLVDEPQEAPEISVEEPVEETPQPVEESADQADEVMPTIPQENFEVSVTEPEAEEAEASSNEVTDEPVLGGQNNLFLKPTVMTDIHVKKQHTGPKVNIKFGS